MKILLSFVLALLLFFCPFAVQAEDIESMPQEEIGEVPLLDPTTEAEINDFLSEDPYIGETDLRGNKVSTIKGLQQEK